MKNQVKGTNYRTVYKSDHLGVIDLEEMIEAGKPLIFKIKEVKQQFGVAVAGNKINGNIAYFEDGTKPLVLNSTNAKVLKNLSKSAYIENWAGLTIELYIDPTVKMKGEIVGGVRIKNVLASQQKPLFTVDKFEAAYQAGADKAMIEKGYTLTPEIEQDYIDYCNSRKA